MILTPSQNKIAESTVRFRVVNCGRRFGKTTLAIEEIKGKAVAKDSRICYVAPTYQQARDIAWEQLKKEFIGIAASINESRLEIRVPNLKKGESVIMLRGWESIETLRGQKFDFIVIDEIASMRNFQLHWEEVIRPTLTDTVGECLFISTPKGFNHFYDLYNKQETDVDYKSFHFTSYDNPHLPVEELDKARKEIPEDRFAQEYLADFRKSTGLVYKEFDRQRHVYTDEDIKKGKIGFVSIENLVGIDWGFTNPAAIYKFEKDNDGKYYITREYYKTGKTTPELIEYISTLNGNKFYPDPAEPDRNEELRRAGMIPREVSKDVEAGINSVREMLNTGRLLVHSSCINLINEFETYSYPDRKPNQNEYEAPIKENDHAMDAIRYVIYMQGRGNGIANVRYSQSSMPMNNMTSVAKPKQAYVHVPRL